jgi:hypothetical protein
MLNTTPSLTQMPAGQSQTTSQPDQTPILPVLGVNLVSLFLFLTSPIDWGTTNMGFLALLVLVSQAAVFFGFRNGLKFGMKSTDVQVIPFSVRNVFTVLLVLYSATVPIHYAYIARTNPTDPLDLFGFLQYAWQDSSAGRRIVLDSMMPRTVPWRFYFLISLVNRFFFALGFIVWPKLHWGQRLCFAGLVGLEVWFWVAAGTNFGIVVIAITFLFSRFVTGTQLTARNFFKPRNLVIALVVGVLAIFVFLFNLYARSGRTFLEDTNLSIEDMGVSIESDSLTFQLIPDFLLTPYMYILSYLCQGYYHTCMAFELDFVWTRMVGSIPAMTDFALTPNSTQWERTYMFRLGAMGIDPTGNWHSSYTWYANDVTFYGVPALLGIMGYLFGYAWSRSFKGDLLSRIIFITLGNALFFLWANNTYLSSVFYPFMFLFPYWLFTRVLVSRERRLLPI